MKKIGVLMLAILVSMPCISALAETQYTESVRVLTAVPQTMLNPSLRVMQSHDFLNVGIPALTVAPEFAGGVSNDGTQVTNASTGERERLEPMTNDGSLNMNVRGVISQIRSGMLFVRTPWGVRTLTSTNGLKDAKIDDEIILLVDANNMIIAAHQKAEGEFADARPSRGRDNILWHSVADIASVVNNG
jgi:hypothetical protein